MTLLGFANSGKVSRFVTAGYLSLLQQSKPRLDQVFCPKAKPQIHYRFRKGLRVLCFLARSVKDILHNLADFLWFFAPSPQRAVKYENKQVWLLRINLCRLLPQTDKNTPTFCSELT
jgi:hypothetical protein